MKASDYRLAARDALRNNWGVAVGTTLVAMMLGGVGSDGGFEIEVDLESVQISMEILMQLLPYIAVGSVSAILIAIFVSSAVSLGYQRFILNLHDGSTPEFKDLFSQFRKGSYMNAVLLSLLQGVYILAWSLLFIIPGIIATYSYAMAPYIMLDHPELTPNQCITASKRMMNGHKWELFCLSFSFIGWSILSAFTFGIGSLFLIPYENTAFAAFYRNLSQEINIYDCL